MKGFKALTLTLALAASVSVQAQQSSTTAAKTTRKSTKTSDAEVAARLTEMQHSIEAQQQQIQQLLNTVQSRDAAIQSLQQQVTQAQSAANQAQQAAETAAAQASKQTQDVASVKNTVTDLQNNQTNVALSLQDTQKRITDAESPTVIHYKGVTITPGGFLAAETVYRQHALGADINTPFNSIPYPGSSQNSLSEFYGSGRQSRISMLTVGDLGSAKLSGYVEADFLSAGTTSNNNQSNSYTMRFRQAWGQAALHNGWTFTGGQMWSLVTETKKGLDNRSEALPMTIDPQYTVGFSWARQYGFRVTKNLNNKIWLGVSAEDSQATVGGHGITCVTTAASYPCNNYLLGSQGSSGGLYNPTANYSFNATPDFIFKAAYEPGWGHFEAFGIVSDFRDRIFPNAIPVTPTSTVSASGAYNNSSVGTGAGANGRVSLLEKHVDLGLHFLGGRGIGRYGTGGLPDVVIRPDGVVDPIKSYQSLATLELHYPKIDVYFNFGGEYDARTTFNSGKTGIGYGSSLFNNSGCSTETLPTVTTVTVATSTGGTATVPVLGSVGTPLSNGFNPGGLSKCSGDTKDLLEFSSGFWYRFYKGPKGTLQAGPQYSYVIRDGWSGGTYNPQGTENMFFTSFRYYLP